MNRRIPARRILDALSSLRLTLVLLILSILLVFAATLAQVHLGVWAVQVKYFHSFLVWGTIGGAGLTLPIFPGGYTIGGALLVNLIAAHIHRFRFSAAKAGIWATHLGLILLLMSEGLSGLMQREGQMRLNVGQTSRYSESFHGYELALVDATSPNYDEVVAIPATLLARGDVIGNAKLPFQVKPLSYRESADGDNGQAEAYVQLVGAQGPLGLWRVSTQFAEPQTFPYQGRTWRIRLQARRDYLPFTVTLVKFTHDVYAGTDIPKNFASIVRLRSDDGRDDREVRIFMNNPLRYGGRAFYQAGYANNDHTSVFQVVRNPSWRMPYFSCALIGLGLLGQFGIHLWRFLRGRRCRGAAAPNAPVAAGVPAMAGKGVELV